MTIHDFDPTGASRALRRAGRLCAAGLLGVAAAACLAAGAIVADEPGGDRARESREFSQQVRADFFRAFRGDQAALARAMKLCEETLAKDPKHPEALVQHGVGLSARAVEAFRKGDRERGLALRRQAGAEMDEAVRLAPEAVGVRIARGVVLLQAARFVEDPAQRREMLEKVVADLGVPYARQKEQLDRLGEHRCGELLFGLAEGYRRLGQEEKARSFLEQILRFCQDTPYEKEARAWLAEPAGVAPKAHQCIGCHSPAKPPGV
jgi:hypothetical protein